jgi:GNAT superfamily N-acetyltransferase
MNASEVAFRSARPDEGVELTELAVRAKSHWGYDVDFLDSARRDLMLDADSIRAADIYVLVRDDVRIGFYGLLGRPPQGRLEWMFIEPEHIGHGYGRVMWDDAVERAAAAGFTELEIESDRFAEPFYLAMGAERIGATPSPVDGAPLPVLRVHLAGQRQAR